jgi:Protein of unknown function (DUF3995)
MRPSRLAAGALAAISGLHVVWATGSLWPMATRSDSAEAIGGRRDGGSPSPAACLGVAGLLAVAAALVDGHPRDRPRISRAGAGAVAAVLATRGAFGLAGRTDLLSPGADSERFRRLDRRMYSPLCLCLAVAAWPRP